ncbi:ABC transporter permease [Reinekea blandensis]|uniref:ABC-2 type transporter transmembrane domain-containing protein n=1 Tax=Reinekea blandensis MED297 TaxID=314283 RepID=A4BF81_9GAMM|nr:ABC transporter permease [Reinekea blandensis]EAR09194.1 hypothetical protein MED297_06923 [Reinekea sp. MED297] [Reinekea blandensis MED297]
MKTFLRELRWLNRHPGALLILIGAPVLYAVFYPLPYQHAVVNHIPIIVWDAQQSATSRDWVSRLDAHPKLNVTQVRAGEPEEGIWLHGSEVQAFLHIPSETDRKLAHQQPVVVPYGGRADNFLVYSTAMKAIAQTLQEINLESAQNAFQAVEGNAIHAQALAQPIHLQINTLFNDNASYLQYLVPAVFLVIVQQVILIALGMHWGYRFEMQRPMGAPFSTWLAHVAIYLVNGLALILFFYRLILPWQGVYPSGNGLTILSVAVPFILAVIGFAMVISIGFKEQETAILWCLPLSVPFLLLAGASWPTFAMADWAQALAHWIPTTWGINAMLDVAFMDQAPNYQAGWGLAGLWLSLGLACRILLSQTAEAEAPSVPIQ